MKRATYREQYHHDGIFRANCRESVGAALVLCLPLAGGNREPLFVRTLTGRTKRVDTTVENEFY